MAIILFIVGALILMAATDHIAGKLEAIKEELKQNQWTSKCGYSTCDECPYEDTEECEKAGGVDD